MQINSWRGPGSIPSLEPNLTASARVLDLGQEQYNSNKVVESSSGKPLISGVWQGSPCMEAWSGYCMKLWKWSLYCDGDPKMLGCKSCVMAAERNANGVETAQERVGDWKSHLSFLTSNKGLWVLEFSLLGKSYYNLSLNQTLGKNCKLASAVTASLIVLTHCIFLHLFYKEPHIPQHTEQNEYRLLLGMIKQHVYYCHYRT